MQGYWIHKDTGVTTNFDMSAAWISGTTFNSPPWKVDAVEVGLPTGITTLADYSFADATNLKELTLPDTVSIIGNEVFLNCLSLLLLYVENHTPPTFGISGAVNPSIQIKVPAQSVISYRTNSYWSPRYQHYIYAINERKPGARYHGPFISSSPIIYIGNSSGILINGLHFDNPMNGGNPVDAIQLYNCSNVAIYNCRFSNIQTKRAIILENCSNIIIFNCEFDGISAGVHAALCTGIIQFFSNDIKNIYGRMYGATHNGQSIQLNQCTGSDFRIQDNAIENIEGQSSPEDAVNVFASDFPSTNPLLIRNNWIRGGGPSASGGGLLLGDWGGDYQVMENNILVNPGQYGIGMAGGSYHIIRNNLVYSEQKPYSNVGMVIANWTPVQTGPSLNITVQSNRIHWLNASGIYNDWWVGGIDPTEITNTPPNVRDTSLDQDILPTQIIGV